MTQKLLNLEKSNKELWDLKLIYEQQTKFQNIKLYEKDSKYLVMALDTFIQFVEGESEQIYHSNFLIPLKNTKIEIKNILIGGGGDGCLARNLFKLNPSFNITIVDIDKNVINLCKTEPRLLKLNENSLFKCNIIIDDIKKFILKTSNKYDVVLLDLPDPNSDELKKLYSQSFISNIPLILKLNGLFIMQVPTRYRKRILGLSKKYINKDSESFIYEMPFLGEGSFIYCFNKRNYCIKCDKLLCIKNKSGKCNLCNLKEARTKITKESKSKIKRKIIDLWKNKDYREKQIIAHKGKHFINSGQFKKGQHSSPKTEFKKGQHASIGTEFKKGKILPSEVEKKRKEKWYLALPKLLKSLRKRPTSYEQKIINLINKYNLPYKYVGNGQIWINKANPDFININHKKIIIETYCKYLHPINYEDKRSKHFIKYGYKSIFLNEDDLIVKNWEKICLKKIKSYTNE